MRSGIKHWQAVLAGLAFTALLVWIVLSFAAMAPEGDSAFVGLYESGDDPALMSSGLDETSEEVPVAMWGSEDTNKTPTVIVTDGKTGKRVYPPIRCGFGYVQLKSPGSPDVCEINTIRLRRGMTLGDVAEKLGHYSRRGELCYYTLRPRLKMHRPGTFDVRQMMPGSPVGGCSQKH